MQVSCEHCGAEYELDKNSITGRGARITCPTCSHVFVVYQPQEPASDLTEEHGFEIDLSEFDLDMDDILGEDNSNIEEDATSTSASVLDDSIDEAIDLDIDLEVDLEIEDEPKVEALDDSVVDSVSVSEEPSEANPTQDEQVAESAPVDTASGSEQNEAQNITDADISALDVHTLNFASVGIKSWRVKRTFGLMFEYSDFKTFQKSLSDGRITGDDSISPDGENWVVLKTIDDYESHFCRVYLEFQRAGVAPIKKKVKEKVVQPLGGMNELASALAAAQAEVEEAQTQTRKPTSRKKSTPKKSSTRSTPPPVENKSGGSPVVSLIGLIAVLVGGWYLFGRKAPPQEVPVVQAKVDKSKEKSQDDNEALLEEMRAELRQNAAKIEESREVEEPEPSTEEPQLMVKVPEEVLAQQRALKEGKAVQPTQPVKQTNHMEEAQAALQQKQWSKAITSYKAAASQSNSPEIQAGLGYALYKSGQESEGQRTLKLASQQGSVTANKFLGYILKEHGDTAGSNQYFQKYLQSSPTDAAIIRMEMNQ